MYDAERLEAQPESHGHYPRLTADFKQLVISAPYGVMLLHRSGRIEFANPAIYRELQLSSIISNLNSCWNNTLLPKDDSEQLPQLEEIYSTLTHSREQYTLEVKVIQTNQSPADFLLTFRKADDTETMFVYSQPRTADETVPQQAVERDKTAPDTHLYSSLTENLHEGVLIVDDWHTSILYANREACNLIGMNSEEIEHMKPIWFLALLKTGKQTVKNIIRSFNNRNVHNRYLSAEILIYNLRNELLPCEIRVSSVPAVRHRIYRISIFNLSDKKKTMLNVEQLANIKTMASSMVHDIHQPLSAINIAAATLTTRLKRFDVKENSQKNISLLDSISKDTERIKHSISHFKQLSQSREEEKNRVFDAVVELNSILAFYKHLCEQHAITLTVKIKDAAAFIRGNPYLFEQVIINLLNNARHSVREKGFEKTITVHAYSMQSDFILSIEDNGVGIAEENLPKIFEPFFSTKPSDEGTGLGLPIVQDVVHRMGGSIRVESALNSYTIFLVQIPKNTGIIDE